MPNLPLLLPVVLVGLFIAVACGRLLARRLRCPWWVAVALVASLTLVIAVTLTPQSISEDVIDAGEISWPFTWILALLDERTLNVLLFVPLGFTTALIGSRVLWFAVVGVLALPWAVEGIQYLVTWLSRDAQWQDVVDNTVGAVIGLGIGLVVRASKHLGQGSSKTFPGDRPLQLSKQGQKH